MKKSIFTFIFILCLYKTLFSQQIAIPPFNVNIKITTPENWKHTYYLESCLKRELRSLKDIIITDENPDYTLCIAASELTFFDKSSSFIIAYIILHNLNSEKMINDLKELPQNKKEIIRLLTKNLSSLNAYSLIHDENLEILCKQIISFFDTKILEEDRQYYQKILKSLK
ncbi:MAG: hypothetical protein ACFFDN_50380 [Candidatus Hodarchaeota archaeon]